MNTIRLLLTIMLFSGITNSFYAQTFSHKLFNKFLNEHVANDGSVDYQTIQKNREQLDKYLSVIKANHPKDSWTKNEQLAYWINAYNAFTIKLIIDNYPLKSIRDLSEPWDKKFITIEKKIYSLNDIEHKIIRKQFDEPRIHFAVNCASVSCPKLQQWAFLPESLESQLQKVTVEYINDEKHNSINTKKIVVSEIFKWFKADFEKSGGVIEFIDKYTEINIDRNAEILYQPYNWNLNE